MRIGELCVSDNKIIQIFYLGTLAYGFEALIMAL